MFRNQKLDAKALWAVTVLAATASSLYGASPSSTEPIAPLIRAHAHNDYEHERPLLDALENGFTSAEADVHLIGGELLVAHNKRDVQAGKTLQSLYLEPLRRIIVENQGSVYPDGTRFTLFIDIKTDGEKTYKAIAAVLNEFKDILTSVSRGAISEGPVIVIISGNRPRKLMERQSVRYAAYDGRLNDLDTKSDANFIPIISDNWNKHFSWKGKGAMPPNERGKLVDIVNRAHANNQRVRFWATVDQPSAEREALWLELLQADVDLINTDDLLGLRKFLIENDQ